MCSPGTCSWSKVTTSQPLAKSRSAARSVCVPMRTSAATSAAPSSGAAASTRSDWPSAIAAWWVIRASWPPPTMPTTGSPVRESIAASLSGRPPLPRPGGPDHPTAFTMIRRGARATSRAVVRAISREPRTVGASQATRLPSVICTAKPVTKAITVLQLTAG